MRKLTQNEFIERCVDVWGDEYGLRNVVYKNSRCDIIVTCRRHGDFSVKAKNFAYSKSGCPTCGGQKARDTTDFIAMALDVHGSRYDYTNSIYKRYDDPIKITCKTHGDFSQQPCVHLRGSGCPSCAKTAKLSTELFICKAKKVFGSKYDYSLTKYTVATEKVKIICHHHGVFEQIPHNHLAGSGCKLCSNALISEKKRMSQARADTECSKRGLKLVRYSGCANENSEISCKQGHHWNAPIARITRGSGCPVCSVTGYNPAKNGYVYVLISECKKYMKVGLSNNPKSRIRSLRNSTPFKFTTYGFAKMTGVLAPKFETSIHRRSNSANFKGFDGCTEWFIFNQSVADDVKFFNL